MASSLPSIPFLYSRSRVVLMVEYASPRECSRSLATCRAEALPWRRTLPRTGASRSPSSMDRVGDRQLGYKLLSLSELCVRFRLSENGCVYSLLSRSDIVPAGLIDELLASVFMTPR